MRLLLPLRKPLLRLLLPLRQPLLLPLSSYRCSEQVHILSILVWSKCNLVVLQDTIHGCSLLHGCRISNHWFNHHRIIMVTTTIV